MRREFFHCKICDRYFLAGTQIHFGEYHLTPEQKEYFKDRNLKENVKTKNEEYWDLYRKYKAESLRKDYLNVTEELFFKCRNSYNIIYLGGHKK